MSSVVFFGGDESRGDGRALLVHVRLMLHSFGGEESRGNGPGSARSVSVRYEVV